MLRRLPDLLMSLMLSLALLGTLASALAGAWLIAAWNLAMFKIWARLAERRMVR